jgi:hypothetical protein
MHFDESLQDRCDPVRSLTVIVCERRGAWATALAGGLPGEMGLRQTRGLDDCAAELEMAPASLLVLELTRENLLRLLEMLSGLGRRYPLARAIVVAAREFERYEWLVREAGALHFATSPRAGAQLVRLAMRQAQSGNSTEGETDAQAWTALPWTALPWGALPWSGAT